MKEKDLDSELFWFILGLILSWLAMQLYVAGCWMVLSVFAQAIPLWCFHRHYNPEVDYESVDTPEKQERFKKKARRRIYLIVLQMLFLLYPFFMMLPVSEGCSYQRYEGGIIVTLYVIFLEIFYSLILDVHKKIVNGESIATAFALHEKQMKKKEEKERKLQEQKEKEDAWIASLGHVDQLIRGTHIVAINETEKKILLDDTIYDFSDIIDFYLEDWEELKRINLMDAISKDSDLMLDVALDGGIPPSKPGKRYDIKIVLNSITHPVKRLKGFTSIGEVHRITSLLTVIKHRNGLNEAQKS